ncbi:MAG: threonine synthase, partial [Chloroflexi bacterium]|nr:threonine synthase [Chloroflexota bacterium]
MSFVLGYKCSLCGAEYALGEVEYICPKHGDMGNLDVMLDYAAINRASSPATVGESRDFSIWRYAPLLPVENRGFGESNGSNPLFSVGWTPLYRAKRVAASLGLEHVWIKD